MPEEPTPCGSDGLGSDCCSPSLPFGPPSPGTGPGNQLVESAGTSARPATGSPVYLRYGILNEQVSDAKLSSRIFDWSMHRSFGSPGNFPTYNQVENFHLGTRWFNSATDPCLVKYSNGEVNDDMILFTNAVSEIAISYDDVAQTFSAPENSYLEVIHNTTDHQFEISDKLSGAVHIFHDFSTHHVDQEHRGRLKEQTTRQWLEQGKKGYWYIYLEDDHNLLGIVTPDGGQVGFTYEEVVYNSQTYYFIDKIEIKLGSLVTQRVEYTYDFDVMNESDDLGPSSGSIYGGTAKLLQVKTSSRASDDAAGDTSIVKYTQYRYSTELHYLKAVYENDAVARIMESFGFATAEQIFAEDDDATNGSGGPTVEEFASRRYEYYDSDVSTANIPTVFSSSGENLNGKYNATEAEEFLNSGAVEVVRLLKSISIGKGCSSCGSTGRGLKTIYYYLDRSKGSPADQNEVTYLVIADTEADDGNPMTEDGQYRVVYGMNDSGQLLRRAFIETPVASPKYWCESWVMKEQDSMTFDFSGRVEEHRQPSAHTVVTDENKLKEFLDPYDDGMGGWNNDDNTLNASTGVINVFDYDSTTGLLTEARIKQGRTAAAGETYLIAAYEYDGTNDSLPVKSYYYPTKTATVTDGKATITTYDSYWDSPTNRQIKKLTKSLPAIATAQNGSNLATSMEEYYDSLGRLRWTKDGEGYVNYYSYNPKTGGLAYMITDVDPLDPGGSLDSEAEDGDNSGPLGSDVIWEAWTVGSADASTNKPTRGTGLGAALNLVEKTYYDQLGRVVRRIDSGGAEHCTAYGNNETIQFPYWDDTNDKTLVPIQVQERNDGHELIETYSVKAGYTSISLDTAGAPTGFSTAPSQGDYVTWTRYTRDELSGRVTEIDRYHTIPASLLGDLDDHYYKTVQQYDDLDRLEYTIQVVSGDATSNQVEQITQNVYDVRDRVVEVKQGVSGASHDMLSGYTDYPSTVVPTRKTVYDEGGIGDGHVTQVKNYFDTGANDFTGTNYHRNFRGQLRGLEPIDSSGGVTPYTVQDINWAGQVVATATYDGTLNWTTVKSTTDFAESQSGNRRSLIVTNYDDLGRAYETKRYKIAASTGSGSNYFRKLFYYDRNSRQVAGSEFVGQATETAYDGAGRPYQTRKTAALAQIPFVSGQFQYLNPKPKPDLSAMLSSGGGDNRVYEITHLAYEDENVIGQYTFESNHQDSLAGSSEAGIDFDLGDEDYVRRTVYSWYDDADRLITTADYGAGGPLTGAGDWEYTAYFARPGTMPSFSSPDALVTTYAYHADSGRQESVTMRQNDDPVNLVTKTFYDDLGRRLYVVENADLDAMTAFDPETENGTGDSSDTSKDRVTGFVYNGLDEIVTLTAFNADANSGTMDDDQVTKYLYEDTVGADRVTSEIYAYDPMATSDDVVEMSYNVDGSMASRVDQRDITLTYSYNDRRQLALVAASGTALGASVDNTVLSIKREYDDIGRLETITSYANATGTGTGAAIVNQVEYEYNDLDQVVKSSQEHESEVTMSTPDVQYTYDAYSAANIFLRRHRLESLVYPDGRTVYYDYNKTAAESIYAIYDRVRSIRDTSDTGTVWATYDYNGLSRLAVVDYPDIDVKLDYYQGSSGIYAGYDRFGRIQDQFWDGYTGSDIDRFSYTYDYAGNRLSRDIDGGFASNQDHLYDYDGLNRLTTFDEGQLSSGSIASPIEQQDWELDALGNWAGFVDVSGMTTNLDQDRSHNNVNEITAIEQTMGSPVWIDPVHDDAGNMTTIPRPNDPTQSFPATYDAWNRLVSLSAGSQRLVFQYDGLNRRIRKKIEQEVSMGNWVTLDNNHYYYNTDWQVLETRKTVGGEPLEQCVWHPYYVDALATRFYDSNVDGTLEGQHYFTHDANFNVTAAVNTSGAAIERYHYTPYGELTVLDASFTPKVGNTSGIGNSYTYTGRRLDIGSGLYYYRNRYYHAQLGRFVTRDPIGFSGGMNSYAYVSSGPVTGLDPLGLREAAAPFEYVDGAIANWFVGKIRDGEPESGNLLSSDLTVTAVPIVSQFLDNNGCCLCNRIGFVQIAKNTLQLDHPIGPRTVGTGIIDAWYHYWGSTEWFLDGGVPYKGYDTEPCKPGSNGSPNAAEVLYNDIPGIHSGFLRSGSRVKYFKQQFETHLVCLEGREKGAVYGGFEWSHEFTWKEGGGLGLSIEDYTVIRSFKRITLPSDTWKRIVRNRFIGRRRRR